MLVRTVERFRAMGAVSVQVGELAVTFAGPPAEPAPVLEPRDVEEARKDREAAAARERARLEDWSA